MCDSIISHSEKYEVQLIVENICTVYTSVNDQFRTVMTRYFSNIFPLIYRVSEVDTTVNLSTVD